MTRQSLIWIFNLTAVALLAFVVATAAKRGLEYARPHKAEANAQFFNASEKAAVDFNRIIAAHLFGRQQQNAPAKPKPAVAPKTQLNLKLVGMGSSPDPDQAFAIIKVGNKPESVFQPGDRIPNTNAKLYSVEAARVLLDRDGTLESLALERPDMKFSSASSAFSSGSGLPGDIPESALPQPSPVDVPMPEIPLPSELEPGLNEIEGDNIPLPDEPPMEGEEGDYDPSHGDGADPSHGDDGTDPPEEIPPGVNAQLQRLS